MEYRACYVSTESGDLAGRVLTWWREPDGWHAVVRFSEPRPEGYRLGCERRMPATALRSRDESDERMPAE